MSLAQRLYKGCRGLCRVGESTPIACVLITTLLSAPAAVVATASAQQRLPTPGSSWGELRFPGSEQPQDEDNLILEGAIEQGLDFLRLSENSSLSLFGKLNYTYDTEGFDFNRKLKLGAGVKLRHYFSDSKVASLGIKYEIDRRFVNDRSLEGFQLFADWFGSWRLPIGLDPTDQTVNAIDFPGTTWGEIRYPGSQVAEEEDDVILEGALEQGIDWREAPRWGVFNTYAVLDYIADSKKLVYNNSLTFGLGAKFKRSIGSRWLLQYGIEVSHDRRWISGQSEDAVILFINWSGWWDARGKRLDVVQ